MNLSLLKENESFQRHEETGKISHVICQVRQRVDKETDKQTNSNNEGDDKDKKNVSVIHLKFN